MRIYVTKSRRDVEIAHVSKEDALHHAEHFSYEWQCVMKVYDVFLSYGQCSDWRSEQIARFDRGKLKR